MTEKRFGMYQNTLYDDGNILNPFDAMKLLNHFDKENTKLKEENEQLRRREMILQDKIRGLMDVNELKKEECNEKCGLERSGKKYDDFWNNKIRFMKEKDSMSEDELVNLVYEDFIGKVLKIMMKYNIHSLQKLDLVLFYGRTW